MYLKNLANLPMIVVALPICHLKDFIACHRTDLYTVISKNKEKGSEHPPDQSCALNPIKNHVHVYSGDIEPSARGFRATITDE